VCAENQCPSKNIVGVENECEVVREEVVALGHGIERSKAIKQLKVTPTNHNTGQANINFQLWVMPRASMTEHDGRHDVKSTL
jgi:hypothetical protein